jgi:hypothetical protein
MAIDLLDRRNIQQLINYKLLTYELLAEKYELLRIEREEELYWERFINYCHTGK